MRGARTLVGIFIVAGIACGQAPAPERFEVASVKVAGPSRCGTGH